MKRPYGLQQWSGIVAGLYGIALTIAGALLINAGGSSYFALAGAGTVAAAVLAFYRRKEALPVYAAVFAATVIWNVYEAGFAFWSLAPRLASPAAVGVLLMLPRVRRSHFNVRTSRRLAIAAGLAGLILAGFLISQRISHSETEAAPLAAALSETDWPSFANGNDGMRFAQPTQITPANVRNLEVAWIYRTGEDPHNLANPRNLPAFEATPLKIGDMLYLCTPRNQVIALDAETGKERWRHNPGTDVSGSSYLLACRGVSYAYTGGEDCPRRIIAGTVDGRLIALDARNGRLCKGFGTNGSISLLRNLGPMQTGFYGVTSAPLIANGVIVVGGQIFDNISTDMPSGVIRGFDVRTGEQLWAFDTGAEQPTSRGQPPADKIYTRGSPNSWAPLSADEALNMVYVPTGNSSTDLFGGKRTPEMNRYASSVLAIDLKTGDLRWSFQVVHHDLWDYDVPAQPILTDFPISGATIPALIQPTKRGDLFVLDRRTGKPITAVEERPVPQGGVHGETLSPTQPMSTGMPFLGSTRRTEASMWGITPFDQIWCRIKFLKTRYDGPYTPPSLQGSLQSPNQTGASSWGRVSIDAQRKILVANTINLDSIVQLIPRKDADRMKAAGQKIGFPQNGTPYAATNTQFLSPLGLPCNAPPWGEIRAIDLASKKTLWKKPFGTTRNRLPLPIALPMGLPSVGGPLTTATGLAFIGAADDGYFRAFETRTGKELWRARLPAGGQAAPMTYVSSTGRQFVVIAAGGDRRLGTQLGDYVVAYALPDPRR